MIRNLKTLFTLLALAAFAGVYAQTTADTLSMTRPTCKLPDEIAGPEFPDTISPMPDTTIFNFCDQPPMFPGGDSAWWTFVAKSMHYPDPTMCHIGCVTGTAFVRFVVEKDGSVTHVEVLRHPDSEYIKNEAERIVKSSPPWIPGKHNGSIVRCSVVQPIRFTLQ